MCCAQKITFPAVCVCGVCLCVYQGVVDSSTDVELLWTEIKAARELLGHTEVLRQGRLRDMSVTVVGQQVNGLCVCVSVLVSVYSIFFEHLT